MNSTDTINTLKNDIKNIRKQINLNKENKIRGKNKNLQANIKVKRNEIAIINEQTKMLNAIYEAMVDSTLKRKRGRPKKQNQQQVNQNTIQNTKTKVTSQVEQQAIKLAEQRAIQQGIQKTEQPAIQQAIQQAIEKVAKHLRKKKNSYIKKKMIYSILVIKHK